MTTMAPADAVTRFYLDHLAASKSEKGGLIAPCPFCLGKGRSSCGRLVVIINPGTSFHGYFRCTSRCVPGGFPLWYALLAGLEQADVPGYDPDRQQAQQFIDYPITNQNGEMRTFHDRLPAEIIGHFERMTVGPEVLAELQIGYNGRYITYPYVQDDGNCYALRCVFPERPEDTFWHGDDRFFTDPFMLFNVQDIERCTDGALFLCEGEDSLLALRQQGYPGVAVPHHQVFEHLDLTRFQAIRTIFLLTCHNPEANMAARQLAARLGYKVRLLEWAAGTPRNHSLAELARQKGGDFRQAIAEMIRRSKAFSPFASPQREYQQFRRRLVDRGQGPYTSIATGFPRLDAALDGLHGINVIGGAPKVGKSAFAIQVASQMALAGMPVLYYDFENGRQQIYQRILSRLSRLAVSRLTAGELSGQERQRFDQSCEAIARMLKTLRVVNDRQLTAELMRRHIDFLRHETVRDYAVVVIDSLHKLPFKNFTERRTGIDAWLRQLESIRDELQVSFLVISELSRGTDQSYSEKPHLGVFKGSGDIEYSADNAMVLYPEAGATHPGEISRRRATLWVVASREHRPGAVASYLLDYPFWGFVEQDVDEPAQGEASW
ncbi:MAG: DnaB-like helicase C-terminal domain-containing protein [Desulfopila sp.]